MLMETDKAVLFQMTMKLHPVLIQCLMQTILAESEDLNDSKVTFSEDELEMSTDLDRDESLK